LPSWGAAVLRPYIEESDGSDWPIYMVRTTRNWALPLAMRA
jgi:hypothetical protein